MTLSQSDISALFRDFGPAVYDRAYRLLGNPADAEEAMQEAPGWLTWLRRTGFVLVPAGIAAALVFTIGTDPTPVDEPFFEVTRAKGTLALHVYRQDRDGGEMMTSGSKFAPHDKIRFVVDVPAAGRVAIFGVEASGAVYRQSPGPRRRRRARRCAGPRGAAPRLVPAEGRRAQMRARRGHRWPPLSPDVFDPAVRARQASLIQKPDIRRFCSTATLSTPRTSVGIWTG